MSKQLLLYGLKKDDCQRYMETLLSDKCRNDSEIEKIKQLASIDGYHRFRVAAYDLSEPPKFY